MNQLENEIMSTESKHMSNMQEEKAIFHCCFASNRRRKSLIFAQLNAKAQIIMTFESFFFSIISFANECHFAISAIFGCAAFILNNKK